MEAGEEHLLWVEKYRPKTIADCILPKSITKDFVSIVENNSLPNLLLSGTPGTGKTTVAKALCYQLGYEYIFLNGSLEGRNIDTVRNKIKQFASAASFSGKRKVVIMDEADYMNADSVQPSLRNFIEEFSNNTSFIFTCNMKNRVIPALRSRFTAIDYVVDNNEKPKIAAKILKRCEEILKAEEIEYDQKTVTQLIINHFPDFRRILNELQRLSASGKIDAGVQSEEGVANIEDLKNIFKEKIEKVDKYTKISEWCDKNINIGFSNEIYTILLKEFEPIVGKSNKGMLVTVLADYQVKANYAINHQINVKACLAEILSELE